MTQRSAQTATIVASPACGRDLPSDHIKILSGRLSPAPEPDRRRPDRLFAKFWGFVAGDFGADEHWRRHSLPSIPQPSKNSLDFGRIRRRRIKQIPEAFQSAKYISFWRVPLRLLRAGRAGAGQVVVRAHMLNTHTTGSVNRTKSVSPKL
jgi:hypothetical protein